jgi:hypothetical protein
MLASYGATSTVSFHDAQAQSGMGPEYFAKPKPQPRQQPLTAPHHAQQPVRIVTAAPPEEPSVSCRTIDSLSESSTCHPHLDLTCSIHSALCNSHLQARSSASSKFCTNHTAILLQDEWTGSAVSSRPRVVNDRKLRPKKKGTRRGQHLPLSLHVTTPAHASAVDTARLKTLLLSFCHTEASEPYLSTQGGYPHCFFSLFAFVMQTSHRQDRSHYSRSGASR